jgi:hypothetical protein
LKGLRCEESSRSALSRQRLGHHDDESSIESLNS